MVFLEKNIQFASNLTKIRPSDEFQGFWKLYMYKRVNEAETRKEFQRKMASFD